MAEYQVLDSSEAIENEFNYQGQLSCRPHAVEIKSFSVNPIRLFGLYLQLKLPIFIFHTLSFFLVYM